MSLELAFFSKQSCPGVWIYRYGWQERAVRPHSTGNIWRRMLRSSLGCIMGPKTDHSDFLLETWILSGDSQAGGWLEEVTQSWSSKDQPKWCCSRWCCSGGPGIPQPFPRRPDHPVSALTLHVTQYYFQYHCLSGSELIFCCLQSQNSSTRTRMILHIKEQINKGNGQ